MDEVYILDVIGPDLAGTWHTGCRRASVCVYGQALPTGLARKSSHQITSLPKKPMNIDPEQKAIMHT